MTENALRYGVYLPPFGPFGDPAVLVDLAVRAEVAGWDGVFLWDHVVRGSMPMVDAWTALGAIAQATDRVLIGPTVTPLPRRRPWIVARQASTVSRLSNGRLIFGVGLGADTSGDFSRFDEEAEDFATRSSMLNEGLDVIRALWSGESLEHDGAHYKVSVDATPPERHPIPVWMASSTRKPGVIRRAAACDGIFPIGKDTLRSDDIADVVTALRKAGLTEDTPYDIVTSGQASSAWDTPNPGNVDLGGLAEAGTTWWLESLRYVHPLEQCLEVVDAGPPE